MPKHLYLWAVLCVAGCGQADSKADAVPDHYEFLFGGMIAYDDMPAIRARLPYEKIQLQRFSTWIWGGPITTLWRDGRAEKSEKHELKGEVRLHDFGSLCYLIDRLEFSSMEPVFHWGGFDATEVTVRVWPVGAEHPIEVSDTGNVGPIELWAIQTAIEGVASRVDWETATDAKIGR